MNLNVPTVEDLHRLYKQLLHDLQKIFAAQQKIPKLLTGREVCKMLHLSVGKLKKMRDRGDIEFIDSGKKYLYELEHILEIIERNKRNKGLMLVLYCLLSSYMDVDVLCA